MFYCERHVDRARAEVAKLSDGEINAAVWAFVNDFFLVAEHVLRDADAYPQTSSIDALLDALRARTVPPTARFNRIVGFVLNELGIWRPKTRPLTEAESQVLAAAWRLSDRIHGPRSH